MSAESQDAAIWIDANEHPTARVTVDGTEAVVHYDDIRHRPRRWVQLLQRMLISSVYTKVHAIYTRRVAKHLIDLDEPAFEAARAELKTLTIKETVNEALRLAARDRHTRVARALDVLAGAELDDRADAWR